MALPYSERISGFSVIPPSRPRLLLRDPHKTRSLARALTDTIGGFVTGVKKAQEMRHSEAACMTIANSQIGLRSSSGTANGFSASPCEFSDPSTMRRRVAGSVCGSLPVAQSRPSPELDRLIGAAGHAAGRRPAAANSPRPRCCEIMTGFRRSKPHEEAAAKNWPSGCERPGRAAQTTGCGVCTGSVREPDSRSGCSASWNLARGRFHGALQGTSASLVATVCLLWWRYAMNDRANKYEFDRLDSALVACRSGGAGGTDSR